jgi:hypothetical protein
VTLGDDSTEFNVRRVSHRIEASGTLRDRPASRGWAISARPEILISAPPT